MNQSHIAWQGTSWRLRVEQKRFADGTSMKRGFIEHPGAVVLVPLRDSAAGPEVLMLKQYRPALKQTILELPAGTRGWEEDWLVCAQRELREETGFRAEEMVALGQCWPAPGLSDELMTLYLATHLHPAPLPQDIDEQIVVMPMLLDELVEMAGNGRIQDAKSVVGILRTAVYLERL